MKKIQKFLVDKSFTVQERDDWNNSPMFCPICDFVMGSYYDHEYFEEYMCCKECFLTFVESRKKKWLDGWRPTLEEINIYKEQIRCNSPAFILS